jgi:predicted RNA-binding protein with PUA-like domain
MPKRWLVKSDPDEYGWPELIDAGSDCWDGVRNHQARNFLEQMAAGDEVLFYHSQKAREVVGVARVTQESYPDPTADDPRWLAVDLEVVAPLVRPVGLKAIKAEASLQELLLIKQSRLSVMPIPAKAFQKIVRMGGGLAG